MSAAALRSTLASQFPNCFSGKGQSKPPLKIGIHKDIGERTELTPAEIRLALSDYTRGPTYLRNLTEGADRLDLDGQPCGTVTAREAEYAASMLARMKRRVPVSTPGLTLPMGANHG